MTAADHTESLQARVAAHHDRGEPLEIVGGGTRRFYGRRPAGAPLEVGRHRGVVRYEPTELTVTVRAGTPVAELEGVLAAEGQMLAFEPPRLEAGATVGGAVATGWSGPRRPYAGALRDFLLGARILNGRAQVLGFGGEVMKNVAGYDAFRLQAGALGTLGVVLEASFKVLPRPAATATLVLEADAGAAVACCNALAGQPQPLAGAAWEDGRLWLRLEGTETGVDAARRSLGGEPGDPGFWARLGDHRLDFFRGEQPLWRLAVPPAAPPLAVPGAQLLDWGGAQRWLRTEAGAGSVREAVARVGGHAALFRGPERDGDVFQPLPAALAGIHRRLKAAFDPRGILNRGRLYPDF